MTAPAPRLVALAAARAFEAASVPYVLGGSMASAIYGEPRATLDVDFATLMRDAHVAEFARQIRGVFSCDPAWIREAVARHELFQIFHIEMQVKVDVYVRPNEGIAASEIRRGLRLQLGSESGDTVVVASPEDTVLAKLRWYRDGGEVSDRQWRDIAGVLKATDRTLDRRYMDEWAAKLGLSGLLDRAWAQS